jgi:hypothetical protein
MTYKHTLITLIFPLIMIGQGHPMDDMTWWLSDMDASKSVGNACDVGNYLDTNVFSDMNMNFNTLEVLNARITIHGVIVNEGTILFLCDTAVIEFAETLTDGVQTERNDFKIYPNPAVDIVNINGVGIEKIEIFDALGKAVKRYRTMTQRNMIDVSNLSTGIYLVVITSSDNKMFPFRMLKK